MARGKMSWSQDNRKMLEHLLKQGFRVAKISQVMGIPSASIYNEIRRGVKPEEYNNRQYIKYSAEASLQTQLEIMKKRLMGEMGETELGE